MRILPRIIRKPANWQFQPSVLFLLAVLLVVMLAAGCASNTAPSSSSLATSNSPPAAAATSSPLIPATPAAAVTTPATTQAKTASSPVTSTRAANDKVLLVASTTSTRDSGLMDAHDNSNFPNWPWDGLVPLFEKQTGYQVKAVYIGTGAAMTQGQQGNADALLVHAPDSEVKFIAAGLGINRTLIMHNDFIIVGPASDPASINGQTAVMAALQKIAAAHAAFYSRGDNSGTDQLDKKIWGSAGVTVKDGAAANPKWYIEGGAGTGMGALLLIADQKGGYTITDRATYLANKDKIALQIMVQGDPLLLNIYHAIEVNPAKFPGIINTTGAKAFIDFMVSPATQTLIAKYGADKYGAPLFFADAGKTEAELGSK